ncbi:putative glutathione S-transferase [Cinnamomum micranthum f. kanehirae]|uniref:Putative glutathione S-transferase n=1 Tax=Cinnamomum micranthum f. kanehirae TaxID=337451 RepID=A0A3S3QF15_9MAGN|nr:putative glutathione S-transferase [Cinnamomum micranthum f. kanehirae]
MVSKHGTGMADGMHGAEMKEWMQSLQSSQVELKATYERHGAMLTEILQRLDELKMASKHHEGSSGHSSSLLGHSFGNNGGIHTMKLDFPHFDGRNPNVAEVTVDVHDLLVSSQGEEGSNGAADIKLMAIKKLHGSMMLMATLRAVICLKEEELKFNGDHKKEPFVSVNPFGPVRILEMVISSYLT